MTNVVVINENIKFSEKEYYHKDFPSFVNCYLQNTTTKPILLKGEFESGKKTMVSQLGKIIGKEPKVFDFAHSCIDGNHYMDQTEIVRELRESEFRGDYIVIKDFDQLDTYDTYLLMTYFLSIENNKNPKSTIVIIDNSIRKYFRDLTDVVRRGSASITIGKDPIIEAKIQKEKEEQEKAKQKKMKGVNN
ncbi:MAG: hypothetical protein E7162_06355 [Firmicutes bacterium]|nr:hypothetical protein [Bacillota bacterium]